MGRPRKRKKKFPCGHKAFGKTCVRCETEEARLRTRREQRNAREALIEAAPVYLYGLPSYIQDQALVAINQLREGIPWKDLNGKVLVHTTMGSVLSIPLGRRYRLILSAPDNPLAVVTHERYSKVIS